MDDIFKILLMAVKRNSLKLAQKSLEKKTAKNEDIILQQEYKQIARLLQKYYKSNLAVEKNFLQTPCIVENKIIDNEMVSLFLSKGDVNCNRRRNLPFFFDVQKRQYVFVSLIFPKYKLKSSSLIKFNDIPSILSQLQYYTQASDENFWILFFEISHFSYSKIYKLMSDCFYTNLMKDKLPKSIYILKSFEKSYKWKFHQNYNSKIINLILENKNNEKIYNDYCKQLVLVHNKKFDFNKYLFAMYYSNEFMQSSNKNLVQKKIILRSKEIIKVLLDLNMDTSRCDDEKNTILHIIAKDQNLDNNILKIVEFILRKKETNVNAQNRMGMTPLHYAIKNPSKKIKLIELFVKHNADVNSTEYFELKTPLHFICQQQSFTLEESIKIIDILISAGADIDAKDINGKTPLYTACSTNVEILSEILNHGADINIEYEKDKTILDYLKDNHVNFKSYNFIRDHLLKLIAAGIPIGKKLENLFRILEPAGITYMKQVYVDQYHSFLVADTFLKDCDDELYKMKNTLVNNHTSLYDILFKDINSMANLANNQFFVKILNSDSFNSNFSNYGFLLKLQFKKGFERMLMMSSAKHQFITIVNKNLPDLCLENIFKYLSNKDLDRLLKV